jgi:gas vesicle protein
MNTGKIFLGLLTGVAIGATLGILFAPDKGSKTRKKIIRIKDEYTDEVEDKIDDFIGGITEKLDHLKSEASRVVKMGKSEAKAVEDEVAAVVHGKK